MIKNIEKKIYGYNDLLNFFIELDSKNKIPRHSYMHLKFKNMIHKKPSKLHSQLSNDFQIDSEFSI